MKILVTGANGLLGQTLVRQLVAGNHEVAGTGRGPTRQLVAAMNGYRYQDLDITDGPALTAYVESVAPDWIIHAAAMTQVDECELHPRECYEVNVTATRFVIEAARRTGSALLYVSTDFVFDGSKGPYTEEDRPAPVNYYGSTKLAAERAVMRSGLHWAIARTILVYGASPASGRTNIVGWVKQMLDSGQTIRMVTDQFRTPTFVDDLAAGIILMVEKGVGGIFHLSGEEQYTPYEMAVEVAKFFGLDTGLILPSASPDIRQPAIRPPRTGFDISKAKRELGFRPRSFRDGLRASFLDLR